jgi:hypothetical protein
VNRLSIRARLTLVVAATLALVLFAVGLYVFERVSAQLNEPIAADLQEHLQGVGRGIHRGDPFTGRGPPGTQVLDAQGRVLNRTAETPRAPMLAAGQIATALRDGRLPAFDTGGRRYRAVANRWRGRPVVVVAMASLA